MNVCVCLLAVRAQPYPYHRRRKKKLFLFHRYASTSSNPAKVKSHSHKERDCAHKTTVYAYAFNCIIPIFFSPLHVTCFCFAHFGFVAFNIKIVKVISFSLFPGDDFIKRHTGHVWPRAKINFLISHWIYLLKFALSTRCVDIDSSWKLNLNVLQQENPFRCADSSARV